MLRQSQPRAQLLGILLALLLGACAHTTRPYFAEPHLADCQQQFTALDELINQHQVRDGQHVPVPGYPSLRSNRLIQTQIHSALPAHMDGAAIPRDQAEVWLRAMADLGQADYRIEHARLPAEVAAQVDLATLARCQADLIEGILNDPSRLHPLLASVQAREEYCSVQRAFGLYPITQLAVAAGVRSLQRETRASFALPLEELPVTGQLQRYRPALAFDGVTDPAFQQHAPVLLIDLASPDDRLGYPQRDTQGELRFVEQPVLFVHRAQTLFEGQELEQLVYVFWFPARTATGSFDLLAGQLDGLSWRVTLDTDGEPLLYDVIHNCGCYHQFFPTPRLKPEPIDDGQEPALVPAVVTPPSPNQRLQLRLSAGNHYLVNVSPVERLGSDTDHTDTRYQIRPYDDLRRNGLFPPDGIIAESKRGEWITLWPMGVPAPGAMRQWGRHATAFVGRRYFDEAHLIERYFERSHPPNAMRVEQP